VGTLEAIRLNAGLPHYESMYGPLLTVALAGVFRVAGLNLLAARMTMSILSFALAVFLSVILCRDRLRPWLGFAVLLLLLDQATFADRHRVIHWRDVL
jgi:hypothetical protein